MSKLKQDLDDSALSYRIFVVDDHSGDNTVERVRQAFPETVCLENEKNRGFASSVNRGLSEAGSDFVLLLNNDVDILDRAVTKSVEYLQAHKKASILGCRNQSPDGRVQLTAKRFHGPIEMFFDYLVILRKFVRLDARLRGLDLRALTADEPFETDWVVGSFLLARGEVFKNVGHLDERFFMNCEEVDWCFRAGHQGYKAVYYPGACVVHYGGISSGKQEKRFEFLWKSRFLYLQKHFGPLEPLILKWTLMPAFALNVLFWMTKLISGRMSREEIKAKLRLYRIPLGITWEKAHG